jgi:tetratricopeptide (TPR) repeat protein
MALGVLSLADDDRAAAAELLTRTTRTENPTAAHRAHLYLALMRLDAGEPEQARHHLEEAVQAQDLEVVNVARYHLARLAAEGDQLDRAAGLLERLLDDSDPADITIAPVARAYLCTVLLRQGRLDDAAPYLRDALTSDTPDVYATVFFEQGDYLLEMGEVDAAAEWLTRAIDTGVPEILATARCSLGQVRLAQSRLPEAEGLLRAALNSDDPAVDAAARRFLGSVLARQGRTAEAQRFLEPVTRTASEHRPAALRLLGQLAVIDRRDDAAREYFAAAIDAGDDEIELRARLDLGELLRDQSLADQAAEILAPLADLYGDLGRQAREVLSDANQLRPRPLTPVSRPAPAELVGPRPGRTVPVLPAPLALLLGEVAAAEGNTAEARWWIRQLEDDPQDPATAEGAVRLLAQIDAEGA